MENWLVTQAISYGINRLKEPSTWAGIAVSLAASLHMQFNNDFVQAFVSVGVAISAALAVVLKEGVRK